MPVNDPNHTASPRRLHRQVLSNQSGGGIGILSGGPISKNLFGTDFFRDLLGNIQTGEDLQFGVHDGVALGVEGRDVGITAKRIH